MKKAVITGIFGQDGSYLCEILYSLGYKIYGITKKTLSENSQKIRGYLLNKGIIPNISFIDLADYESLKSLLLEIKPDKIFHVAAQHVSSQCMNERAIFNEKYLFDYNVKSTSNILSICYEYLRDTKIITAGSCLMFDDSGTYEQNETTPFKSRSLYGLAKITENSLIKYYRDHGLFCSMAILYNHESSRRKDTFVTKKIIKNMVAIKNGSIHQFELGDLNAKKDWGYAKDYSFGMYLMSQQNSADDFILSSYKLHSVEDFIRITAEILEIPNWKRHVKLNPDLIGRKITNVLLGNNEKAKNSLSWKPTLDLKKLIQLMVNNELYSDLI
jgi:GDPmannose 4,6-dehydratase